MDAKTKELAQEFSTHTETMTGIETEYIFDLEDLERFAELIRQDEREACAKLCEEENWSYAMGNIIRSERGVA